MIKNEGGGDNHDSDRQQRESEDEEQVIKEVESHLVLLEKSAMVVQVDEFYMIHIRADHSHRHKNTCSKIQA